jgi:hypothetical protein
MWFFCLEIIFGGEKMKKILVAFLALVIACMPLYGCPDKNSKEYGLPEAGKYPMTITDGNGTVLPYRVNPKP